MPSPYTISRPDTASKPYAAAAAHAILALSLLISAPCPAGEADVTDAVVECDTDRRCTFSVTVSHADAGWEHYADHWRVLDAAGEELGRRVLLHPHTNEQPFTRSLSGVTVPAATGKVTLQAHDSVHRYGGVEHAVTVP